MTYVTKLLGLFGKRPTTTAAPAEIPAGDASKPEHEPFSVSPEHRLGTDAQTADVPAAPIARD